MGYNSHKMTKSIAILPLLYVKEYLVIRYQNQRISKCTIHLCPNTDLVYMFDIPVRGYGYFNSKLLATI